MIHILDTHEITYEDDGVTPQRDGKRNFLYWQFKEEGKDITIAPLEVGDWFSYEMQDLNPNGGSFGGVSSHWHEMHGNLVELKIGDDFGIHTEPLERFRDECYRMACFRQQNPHVQLHAVWVIHRASEAAIRLWYNYCCQYHIWGHIVGTNQELVSFLKSLDQPSSYKEFEPFIKRSHEEPTILAKMFRQFPGISSENAIKIAEFIPPIADWGKGNGKLRTPIKHQIQSIIGYKKNGEPYKLALDLIRWLETGEI